MSHTNPNEMECPDCGDRIHCMVSTDHPEASYAACLNCGLKLELDIDVFGTPKHLIAQAVRRAWHKPGANEEAGRAGRKGRENWEDFWEDA